MIIKDSYEYYHFLRELLFYHLTKHNPKNTTTSTIRIRLDYYRYCKGRILHISQNTQSALKYSSKGVKSSYK